MGKILIADDSAFMRNILKNTLNQFPGHEIIEAQDGEDALNKFKENSPIITFLDIMMPKKTGLEALKDIKAVNSSAKIVMCTSVGQEQVMKEAVQNGANDFIVKPFKPEQIKAVMDKLVTNGGSAPAPAQQPAQPAPAQPQQPAPAQPAPTQPQQPAPAQPAPTQPQQPAPAQPQQPAPAQPAPTQPQQPAPAQPAPTQPQQPAQKSASDQSTQKQSNTQNSSNTGNA